MTQQLTPPPMLVAAWCREADHNEPMFPQVAAKAAQWGADQELEACCEWLMYEQDRQGLRAARRPKPKSLKEQALAELAEWESVMDIAPDSPIRLALEQLSDHEYSLPLQRP